jgi:hypothetical protein
MDYKNSQKLAKKYKCNLCDYNTLRKNDYKKHLQSKKHNDYMDNVNDYICVCGKKYNYRQNLYRHKLTCNKNKIMKPQEKLSKMDNIKKMSQKIYNCDCGRSYKYNTGLSKHKKICKMNDDYKNIDYKQINKIISKLTGFTIK